MSQPEYKTTGVQFAPGAEVPWPVLPDGEGWRVASSAITMLPGGMVLIVWTWARAQESKSCPQCNAVAFNEDGACLGCGTVQQ